jgi:hypothetical protein
MSEKAEHAYAIALGVYERDILPHAGYLHRFPKDFGARFFHIPHMLLKIFDCNHH